MKRKLKTGVKRILLILFLFLFATFYFLFFIKDNNKNTDDEKIVEIDEELGKSYLNEIINIEKLDDGEIKLLTDFFDTYYRSVKVLKEYDMKKFFIPDSESALINETAMSIFINTRKVSLNDLTLKNVKYDLNIESVENVDNDIKIVVLENNLLNFSFMSEVDTKVYNIKNEFVLRYINDEYKIVSYNKVKDFYVMVTKKYNGGGIEELNNIKKDYLTLAASNITKRKIEYNDFINGRGLTKKVCDHEYNREKAYEYAVSWVNARNPEWSTFGSNCQNFASQVVYSGGVIMDYKGANSQGLQWKFFGPNYNSKEEAKGYNYAWTYVPTFYEYAKNNTGMGLCASVDVNMYYAEPGDIIHVGSLAANSHALVVTRAYKKDDKLVDILVNSNTIDLENYPMSAYAYPYSTLIKIFGWND